MQSLPLILRVPLLSATLLCMGTGIYCSVRGLAALRDGEQALRDPLIQLTIRLIRFVVHRRTAELRRDDPDARGTIVDSACYCSFGGGALVQIGAVLFVQVVSSGTLFAVGLARTTALGHAAKLLVPAWVMGYLYWRGGRIMTRSVTPGEPRHFPGPLRLEAWASTLAVAFCFLAGGQLADGLLVLVRWMAFAVA